MKGKHWKVYLAFVLLTEGVGALAGWLTRNGMARYQATVRQPPLSPPEWAFPVVWVLLYALMAVGAARVWLARDAPGRALAQRLFFVQLAFNFIWPLIFFGAGRFAPALLWLIALWALVMWMIAAFERVDRPAAWLQSPYLLWLTFALYLNFAVWLLNK